MICRVLSPPPRKAKMGKLMRHALIVTSCSARVLGNLFVPPWPAAPSVTRPRFLGSKQPAEGTSLRYRLNWGAGGKRIEQTPEYSVFVGDLSPEVTDAELKATFLEKYSSVLGAKVVTNPMTGSSKSFGFIRFGDEQERDEALTAMNGAECCGRPIRVAPATKRTGIQGALERIFRGF